SGAWNTGILKAASLAYESQRQTKDVFIAVLDDDDEWDTDHLAVCMEAVNCGEDVGMVKGEVATDKKLPESVNQLWRPAAFLSRNPGIQGSNLFVRLYELQAAGMFDEALTSCTDRDLMLRMVLSTPASAVRMLRANVTVTHHAEWQREDRMSAAGSPQKLQGLDQFWRKWAALYCGSPELADAHRKRSIDLFKWLEVDIRVKDLMRVSELPSTQLQPPSTEVPIVLHVGIIADSDSAAVKPLLEDLGALNKLLMRTASQQGPGGMTVVVLENKPASLTKANESLLWRTAREVSVTEGLDVRVIALEEQLKAEKAGLFSLPDDEKLSVGRRQPIAISRSILQAFLACSMEESTHGHEKPCHVVAWVLDDDKRMTASQVSTNKAGDPVIKEVSGASYSLYLVQEALHIYKEHASPVVIGVDAIAAPLPAAYTIRCQLEDVMHELLMLEACGSGSTDEARRAAEDAHYRLATSSWGHLQLPFKPIGPKPPTELTAASDGVFSDEALNRLVWIKETVLAALGGCETTRPLLAFPGGDEAPQPSFLRGGNTFMFSPEALRQVPNTAPKLGGVRTRRSDFIFCLLHRHVKGTYVLQSKKLAVSHDR
ncbi:unnamed protein product, partial [Chrysoparadoxa australica]